MAFEMGACSPEEYIAGRNSRVMENELRIGSYYTWVLALHEASVKVPARIENITVYDETSGIFIVRNTMFDESGQPISDTRDSLFLEGFYTRERYTDHQKYGHIVLEFPDEGKEEVLTGYFRDDYGKLPDPADESEAELEASGEIAERPEGVLPVAA